MNENELTLNEIKESRKHKLKVWLATLGVALFSGLVAVGVFVSQSYKKSNAYSYSDNDLSVTITADELNNYTFSNLCGLNVSYFDMNTTVVIYNEEWSQDFSNLNTTYYIWSFDLYEIELHLDSYEFRCNYDESYIDFEYDLTFMANSESSTRLETYNAIKNAVELDIQANTIEPLVLSAYDLNNKTYGYLATQVNSFSSSFSTDSYLIYDGVRYSFNEISVDDWIQYINDDHSSYYIYLDIAYDSTNFGKWIMVVGADSIPFTHDLYIYSDFIQENLYAPMDTNGFISILDTIVSILTVGIVGVSTGVGAGVSSLVSDIFITNNALSVFAGMIIVFAGISLAIGLCRWVMNFLTSLGAKK